MKKTLLFVLLFFSLFPFATAQFPVAAEVQDSFSLDYLRQFAYPLEIRNGKLAGKGGAVLRERLGGTQFVALGEYHGSAALSRFTKALLPELKKQGYGYFCAEIGPNSAPVLEALAGTPSETQANLKAFYSKYYLPEDEDIPIPFFDGMEDAAFLAEAKAQGFDLWGMDQEYFTSAIFLSDRLLQLKKEAPNYLEIKMAKVAFDSTFMDAYRRDVADESGFRMFKTLIESPEVKHYFSFFEKLPAGKAIADDLLKSWDIYDRNYYRGGYSHGHRIAHMRNNFLEQYQEAPEESPKVFIKTGGFHAAKNYAGSVYDVGNLAYELSQLNGTGFINIQCTYRYYEQDGKVTDRSQSAFIPSQGTFQALGRKDQYVLVDLRPILRQMQALELKLPNDVGFHYLKHLVEGFDFLLITPLDRAVEANYDMTTD